MGNKSGLWDGRGYRDLCVRVTSDQTVGLLLTRSENLNSEFRLPSHFHSVIEGSSNFLRYCDIFKDPSYLHIFVRNDEGMEM